MNRAKNNESPSVPAHRPDGSLLVGAMIGTVIMAMATQAMAFGAALGGITPRTR